MPRRADRLPPITRPGAGVGEHFPVNDPRSAKGPLPPQDVIEAVVRILVRAQGRAVPQKEIGVQLRRELVATGRSDESMPSYTSRAIGFLYREGLVKKMAERPNEWAATDALLARLGSG
jgi:hypothetical protein